jgi:phosphate transport system permease protein
MHRKTKKSVLIADKIADRVITIGGIMVIVTVLGILVFLIKEVIPLFKKGTVTSKHEYALPGSLSEVVTLGMDDHKTLSYILFKDGTTVIFHPKSGTCLNPFHVDIGGKKVVSFSTTIDGKHLALGFSDGTVMFAEVNFATEFLSENSLPKQLNKIDNYDSTDFEAVYSKIPGDLYRKVALKIDVMNTITMSPAKKPITALDYKVGGESGRFTRTVIAVDEDGLASLQVATSRTNLLTGIKKEVIKKTHLPALPENVKVNTALINDKGDMAMLVSCQGRIYRYSTEDFKKPVLVETFPLFTSDTKPSVIGFLSGGQSLVVGGTDGSLDIYFLINDPQRGTVDKKGVILARSFKKSAEPATLFYPSARGKSFAIGFNSGEVKVINSTSKKILVQQNVTGTDPLAGIILAPQMDGLLSAGKDGNIRFFEFSSPHPETTFSTLFQKIWYEGAPRPSFTWQSSAGTDDYESKLSLMPLIFGSVKGAFYSLLFAVPIAILSAIYTSEFVDKRIRNPIKTSMEMMASIPSVVLGFVAALVLAPIVEEFIAVLIVSFMVIPVSLIFGSLFWQMIPMHYASRWQTMGRFSATFFVIIAGCVVSVMLAPWFEGFFFHGDFKGWIDNDTQSAAPFLFLLLLPAMFFCLTLIISEYIKKIRSKYMHTISMFHAAVIDMIKWLVITLSAVFASYVISNLFASVGIDARKGLVGTYAQRNTLIVGFAMGFAVIPIIYTIAEDALNSVPDHLRAASIGCGATLWQTAVYVVLPTAASGVFSAVMIGLGRAVGETMIVVMAAGNTPIMDINIFNGLRALSATIAVELPEAVKDGTLYRVLFLSALVLFAMTFVINTLAEVVRIRFRKKATQL